MPNVTFYIRAEHMPPDEHLAGLSSDCVELCTDVLDADIKNVHVIYVAVRQGYGHPVFAEIQYRLTAFRTPEVMNTFMADLDHVIERRTGLTSRIRCFGYAAATIYARN